MIQKIKNWFNPKYITWEEYQEKRNTYTKDRFWLITAVKSFKNMLTKI